MKRVTVAFPDIVTNSYFAALAAIELGCFAEQGIDARAELIYPSQNAYDALRTGRAQFAAAPAHSALAIFPEFRGVKLVAALSQGMYWKLVVTPSHPGVPGDLGAIRGLRIGAAPMVELGLKVMLRAAGIDPDRDVRIVAVPGADAPGASLGVTAAAALRDGLIDGFWANAMGAAAAIRSGAGRVLIDPRGGIAPASALHYTFPALAVSDELVNNDPELVAAGVRAIVTAQALLRADPALAAVVGQAWFPPEDAAAIEAVVRQDLPWTHAAITPQAAAGLCAFAVAAGLAAGIPAYENVAGLRFAGLW